MKISIPVRLSIATAFMLTMGSFTTQAAGSSTVACCPLCQKGSCPLPGATKEDKAHCEKEGEACEKKCAKEEQAQKEGCKQHNQEQEGEEAPQP